MAKRHEEELRHFCTRFDRGPLHLESDDIATDWFDLDSAMFARGPGRLGNKNQ